MSRPSSSEKHQKWEQFSSASLVFGPHARIDLREAIGPGERALLQARRLDRPFAVMTAENPEGEGPDEKDTAGEARRQEAENDRNTDTLERTLKTRRIEPVEVISSSPDGKYQERCFAFVVERELARELARRFGQLAFFFWDGARFWQEPGTLDERPRELPHSSSR